MYISVYWDVDVRTKAVTEFVFADIVCRNLS